MKQCPFCAEEIQDAASVCRYCGRNLIIPQHTHKRFDPRSGVALLVGVFIAELIVALIRDGFWGKSYANPVEMLAEFYTWLVIAYAVGYFVSGLLAGLMASAHRAKWVGLWIALVGFSYRFGHDLDAGMEITSTYAVIGAVAVGAGTLGSLLTGARRRATSASPNSIADDTRSSLPAQRYAPAPPRPALESSQSAGPVVAVMLILAVIVGGVWLAVDGKNLSTFSASSSAAPQPVLASPSPPTRAPVTPKAVNTAFESVYYAQVIDGWKCKTDNQDRVVFTGEVKNIGNRPIGAMSVRSYVYDQNGNTINSNNGSPTISSCLRPGDADQFTIYVAMHGKRLAECGIKVESVSFSSYGDPYCKALQPTAERSMGKATAPAGSASSNTSGGSLLTTMTRIRKNIQALAQDADVIHCGRDQSDSVLNNYDAVVDAPKFSVTGAAQAAYNDYRAAVDIIARTNKDMYLHCSAWVKDTATTNVVPRQTWGTARQGVDQALQAIDSGLAKLK